MIFTVYNKHLRRVVSFAHSTAVNLTKIRQCSSVLQNDRSNSEDGTEEEHLVITEKFESLTIIGLNRPAKRNALNKQLISSLNQAIIEYENDSNAHSAVLYGIGGNFCAGLDLKEISTLDTRETPFIPLVDRLCTKPIVASVTGYAVAEGLILALACDVQIIEDTAVVGFFNRRFGIPLTDDAIRRLVAHTGAPRAMEIILTGRQIRAKEAVTMGLASEIAPCGSARGRAVSFARSLIKFPQASLLADRAALYATFGPSEEIRQAARIQTEKHREQAFKEIHANAARFQDGIGKHGSARKLKDFHDGNWIPT